MSNPSGVFNSLFSTCGCRDGRNVCDGGSSVTMPPFVVANGSSEEDGCVEMKAGEDRRV